MIGTDETYDHLQVCVVLRHISASTLVKILSCAVVLNKRVAIFVSAIFYFLFSTSSNRFDINYKAE